MKHTLLNVIDDFVLPTERARAKSLQLEYDRLEEHYLSLTHDGVKKTYVEARETYLADPTAEKFARLNHASRERDDERAGKNSNLRIQARATVGSFFSNEILKWAQPIVSRGISIAKETLAEIRHEEDARHLRLTGSHVRQSQIIDCASVPVRLFSQIELDLTSNSILLNRALLIPANILKRIDQARGADRRAEKPSLEDAAAEKPSLEAAADEEMMKRAVEETGPVLAPLS